MEKCVISFGFHHFFFNYFMLATHKHSFALSWCLDVEAFAKAMEGSDTKTDDGDSKDKKDDDEDMSLD